MLGTGGEGDKPLSLLLMVFGMLLDVSSRFPWGGARGWLPLSRRQKQRDKEVTVSCRALGAYNNLSHPCSVLTTMENRHLCYLHESIL